MYSNYESESNANEFSLNKKPVMTIREISEKYSIGKDTLYRLVDDNNENSDFPYFKIKSKVLIFRVPFEDWLIKISKERRII